MTRNTELRGKLFRWRLVICRLLQLCIETNFFCAQMSYLFVGDNNWWRPSYKLHRAFTGQLFVFLTWKQICGRTYFIATNDHRWVGLFEPPCFYMQSQRLVIVKYNVLVAASFQKEIFLIFAPSENSMWSTWVWLSLTLVEITLWCNIVKQKSTSGRYQENIGKRGIA